MGQKQGLDTILAAAQLLRPEESLEAEVRQRNLDNVSFIDVQQELSYESMLVAADVLIVNQRASVGDMALPSKLTSYFASGRPVVAAVSGQSETAREMRAAGGGIIVPPETPQALATAVVDLRDSPLLARTYGENGVGYAAQFLDRRAVFPQFDRFLGFLIGSQAPTCPDHRGEVPVLEGHDGST
jgi:glycosyltransferase involved in cell wall biosynthesis